MDIKKIFFEPWAVLSIDSLNKLTKEEKIKHNQGNRQFQKYNFYINVFDFLSDNSIVGDYFEFGCHRARTFRMAMNSAKMQDFVIKFYGFDSFEGLPEHANGDENEKWKTGNLFTSEDEFRKMIEENGVYLDNYFLIKGFYEETLNDNLIKDFINKKIKTSLVTIDCDLYKSSVPVFNFIEPFLQEGSVIYIDDWYNSCKGNPKKGIPLAFKEFQAKSSFKFEEFLNVGWWGKSFIVYK